VALYSNDLHHANLTVLEIVNDIEQNPYVVHMWYVWMFTVFHSHNLVHNLKFATLSWKAWMSQ